MERNGIQPMPPLADAIQDYMEKRKRYFEPRSDAEKQG